MTSEVFRKLPICDGGYVTDYINIRKTAHKELTLWHGKHKPYTCDFPSELIKKQREELRYERKYI